MGKLTIFMAIYTGYVKEPEGNIAMENGSLIDHKNDDLAFKMVIFHSYVKIPEGKCSGSMMQMNHATGYNWVDPDIAGHFDEFLGISSCTLW
jgi:hypothetical protein